MTDTVATRAEGVVMSGSPPHAWRLERARWIDGASVPRRAGGLGHPKPSRPARGFPGPTRLRRATGRPRSTFRCGYREAAARAVPAVPAARSDRARGTPEAVPPGYSKDVGRRPITRAAS